MFLVCYHLLLCWIILSLNLVANDPIFVNEGTKDKVSCLLLDQDVSICANLLETCRDSDPENSFPSILSRKCIVKLICESKSILVVFKVWVEEKWAVWFASKVWKGLQILELSFTFRENEKVYWELIVCEIRSSVLPVLIAHSKLWAVILCTILAKTQFFQTIGCWIPLEKNHTTTNVLSYVFGANERLYDARLRRIDSSLILEVGLEALQESCDDIIAVSQWYKEILRQRQEVVCKIRHDNHLRLLKRTSEIKVVEIFVVG